MSTVERKRLFAAVRITSLGTLGSRILGLLRDMATAALLGLSGSPAMDAFVLAFRVPNLFRRLFGEGALAASYLPVITATLEDDRSRAWKLASVTLTWLVGVMSLAVLLGELACGICWLYWGHVTGVPLVCGLVAIMLPYALLICVAAHLAGTLHALGHFAAPALAPVFLNVVWLATAWWIAPQLSADKSTQARILAACIVVAGVFQVGLLWPVLRSLGMRFDYDWATSRDAVVLIAQRFWPMVLGLGVTQVNTLADTLIAWGLSTPTARVTQIPWLSFEAYYPLQQGAAGAIYFGERLYQFPLGLIGIALATALFPLLSRHAARGDFEQLGADLTLGLRLVIWLGLPSTVGLVILAEPIARLLFERGEFTAEDAQRTGRMIACYATGVWAYCALPVLLRGYYALGDRSTPLRVGLVCVSLNLGLNLALVWPLAETGLAVATAVTAGIQAVALGALFSLRHGRIEAPQVAWTFVRAGVASAVMGLCCWALVLRLPSDASGANLLVRVVVPLAFGAVIYLVASWLLGSTEGRMLLGRTDPTHGSDSQ